jgi:tetratricopeptide (TPR) repeat protein
MVLFGAILALILAGSASSEDARTFFDEAGAALRSGDFTRALEAYRRAEAVSKTPTRKARAANGAGYALINMHRFAQALPHLDRAVELKPDHKLAWNNIGFCRLTLYEAGASGPEALEAALVAFEKVEALDSGYKDVKTHVTRVKAYAEQERLRAAAAAARAGKPSRAPAPDGTYRTYKAAGELAEQEGDFAFAQANFERAETAGRGKRTKSAAANFQGLLALRMRNPEAAIEHCKRAISLNSSNKYAWNNLGAALLKAFNAGKGGKELVAEAVEAFRSMSGLDSSYKPANLAAAESILAKLGGPPQPRPGDAAGEPAAETTSP